MKRQSTIDNFFQKQTKSFRALDSTRNEDNELETESRKTESTENQYLPHETSLQKSSAVIDLMDIGNYIGKVLSSETKLNILQRCWNPGATYKFPLIRQGNQNRKFQCYWVVKHEWLVYSELLQGGFCKFCVLFAQKICTVGNQKLGNFVVTPFQDFRNSEEIVSHAANEYHLTAMERAGNFVKVASNPVLAISNNLNDKVAKIVEENRRRLVPIIKTILFCAHHNLPLRGHRDDGNLSSSENQGLFRSLLLFRIDAGDSVLKSHLDSMKGNATMISKTIQNEIVECIGDFVRNQIILKVSKSRFFTVLLDETTDISEQEQLSVSLRYVDTSELKVKEDFIDFVAVTDTTGQGIKLKLEEIILRLGLDIKYLRGQGYDGGANMAGKYNGLQALIQKENPLAVYCHCFNHSLNLAISSACKVEAITSMFDALSSCCNFFSSAKRNNLLKESIDKCDVTTGRKNTLKSLCATRWVERHESVLVFKELLPATILALKAMSEWDDREVSQKASLKLTQLTEGKFLISLDIAIEFLSVTLPISRSLQNPAIDLSEAMLAIETAKNTFQNMRKNATKTFEKIFVDCQEHVKRYNAEIKMPRSISRQKYRANAPAQSVQQYFRVNVFLPFLDTIVTELETRFNGRFKDIIALQSLIPLHIKKHKVEEILQAASIYEEDLPCSLLELKGQLIMWRERWTNVSDPPKAATEALQEVGELHGVQTLLQIFATLPVSTATPERSFSRLKLIKDYLRSTMKQERLSGLAIASIHRNMKIDISQIINLFASRKQRRMQLINWGDEKRD